MAKKMETKRSFRKLRSSMTEKRFRDFCEDVAIQYAEKGPVYTREYYTKNELITDSCYNKILAYAVICNIVTDDTLDKMEKRTFICEDSLPKEYVNKMKAYYDFLRKVRQKYIVATFSNEGILSIVKDYSSYMNVSKEEIAEIHHVSTKIIDVILKKSIIKNIVSDELLEKLERRCILRDSSESNKSMLIKLREQRNSKRTALE